MRIYGLKFKCISVWAGTVVILKLFSYRDMSCSLVFKMLMVDFKFSKRTSINIEYYLQLNAEDIYEDAFGIGVDIETGGHVFQLHLTNAQSMIESGFIAETTDDFFGGDIHFGFNISRYFNLKPNRVKGT